MTRATYDEEEDIIEIEPVMIAGVTPISCIFCEFITCIAFDMKQHLHLNHRRELSTQLPLRGSSFEYRLQFAINEGTDAGARLQLDNSPIVQALKTSVNPRDIEAQELQGITLWSQLQDKNSFKPIISVEKFFDDEQTLPLRDHKLEQSPCYPILTAKRAGRYILYSCDLHPKKEKYSNVGGNINLTSIEHHVKYYEREKHESAILSRLHQAKLQLAVIA